MPEATGFLGREPVPKPHAELFRHFPHAIDGANPLGEDNPELVALAGTLLHEAQHAQCHDEMAAFGAEVEFYQGVNREFDKYFLGIPATQKDTRSGE